MFTLTTKENKTIFLDIAEIRVSVNSLIDCGYYIDLYLKGKLPGCHKSNILSTSLSKNNISFLNLYGYAKWHDVDPEKVHELVKTIKVVPAKYDKTNITPELEIFARNHIEEICNCPAVRY
jgi:hypothetical protein